MTDLHRFMIAIARVSVNHDGQVVRLLILWFGIRGASLRFVSLQFGLMLILPLFLALLVSRVTLLVLTFLLGLRVLLYWLGSLPFLVLHWPSDSVDLGHDGISFLELLILFEQWAGHRLLGEKVTRPHVRAGRPILVSSVPVSEGMEIRHGCQFISSLVRALGKLPGGLGRFLPCQVGTHLSRLRHLGWNQCSHGLTSRPLRILSSPLP